MMMMMMIVVIVVVNMIISDCRGFHTLKISNIIIDGWVLNSSTATEDGF